MNWGPVQGLTQMHRSDANSLKSKGSVIETKTSLCPRQLSQVDVWAGTHYRRLQMIEAIKEGKQES